MLSSLSVPVYILSGLLLITLLVSILLSQRLESIVANNDHLHLAITSSSSGHDKHQPPHLYPRLPHLPPFPAIPNATLLINQTLYENKPTIAGIAAVLYKHINALHESNRRITKNLTSTPKHGGQKKREGEAIIVREAYFRLLGDNIREFENVYYERSIFTVRDDDSILLSIASYREHLLGETLMSAYAQADGPDNLFVGVVVNNCFGNDVDFPCTGTAEVVGRDRKGLDKLQSVDGKPDANGIETFCGNSTFQKYCDNGQVRVIYLHEVDALGPAVARYYGSKLWGGETFFMQIDSHTRFARNWDKLYIEDLKLTSSYPKSVLSTYPPGFINLSPEPPYKPSTKLCKCRMRADEDFLPRVELEGHSKENETRPSQTRFMGAGFFFTSAQFLVDVPFDPYMAWLFMGEEVALSIRAWTSGYNLYAPRKNLVGHQYRPNKFGNPHFWDIWHKFFHRPQLMDRLSPTTHDRIKVMMGYPKNDLSEPSSNEYASVELSKYGLGTVRSREEYLKFASIDIETRTCGELKWCNEGTLQ